MSKTIVLSTLLALFVLGGTAYGGGSHKGGHGHEKDKVMDHWQAPKSAKQETNPLIANAASLEVGKVIYLELCSRCHGEKLQGDGPDAISLSVNPTNLKEMAGGHSDGDFAWKIRTGKGDMPAWEDELEPSEIWSLVNYIQSFAKNAQGRAPHGHNAKHGQ